MPRFFGMPTVGTPAPSTCRRLARTAVVALVAAAVGAGTAVSALAAPAGPAPGRSAAPAPGRPGIPAPGRSVTPAPPRATPPAPAPTRAAVTTAEYDSAVLADSPVLYWPLNEGSGAVREINGRAAASTVTTGQLGVSGASGTAVALDGSTQRIQVPYTAQMRLTGSFTVELWAKLPSSPQTSGWPTLFSRGSVAPGHFGSAMWVSSDRAHLVNFKRNGYDVPSARGLTSSGYRHLAFTWDSTGQRATWYVDGSLDYSRVLPALAGADAESGPLSIGAMLDSATGSPSSFGKLLVDGLTFYAAPLPAARVAAHYQAAGVTVAPGPAPARRVGGVAVGDVQPWSTTRQYDYAKMAAANATWIRTDIGWKYLQPTSAEWRWSLFDDVLTDLRANNLRYLAILHTVPGWANGDRGDYAPPTDLALLENYCYLTVKHYLPLGVADYEIGNEVNWPHAGWTPTGAYYANNFLVPCVRGARRAAADVSRPVNLIFGSMAPGAVGGGQTPQAFLTEAYANGARGLVDAVAYHPYGGMAPAVESNMITVPPALHDIMAANGDGAKLLWATEYGLPTGGDNSWGEQVQVDWLNSAFDTWYGFSFAGPLFWYAHRDWSNDPTDREHHFGVLRADGSAKPAYAALQARLTR